MLKHLFSLVTILSITLFATSCSVKKRGSQNNEDQTQIIDENTSAQPYQTIDGQEQADALNASEQQRIEEVEVQDRIFFDYDSFALNAESKKVLDVQAAWLNSDLNINVTIEGHADERGTREYNLALGERRAKSVKDYLVSQGVDARRIKIISYGKERPAFFGATNEIFSKNRRAVTVIE